MYDIEPLTYVKIPVGCYDPEITTKKPLYHK